MFSSSRGDASPRNWVREESVSHAWKGHPTLSGTSMGNMGSQSGCLGECIDCNIRHFGGDVAMLVFGLAVFLFDQIMQRH